MKTFNMIYALVYCVLMIDVALSQSPINIPKTNNPPVPQSPSVSAFGSGKSPTNPGLAPAQAPSAASAPPFRNGAATESATPAQLSLNTFSPAAAPAVALSMTPNAAPTSNEPDPSATPGTALPSSAVPKSNSASNNASPPSSTIVDGSLCRAGINIGQVWHMDPTSGEFFVVYMYLTAGSDQPVDSPWKLSVSNPEYADFVQFWNVANVTTVNNTLSGEVSMDWETLQPAAMNTVDMGFVAHSLTNLTDNVARTPVSVTANGVPCEIYKYS